MKVKKLIELLQHQDPEMEVIIDPDYSTPSTIIGVEVATFNRVLKTKPDDGTQLTQVDEKVLDTQVLVSILVGEENIMVVGDSSPEI